MIPDNLRLLSLPPYSSELNPVEHIWDEHCTIWSMIMIVSVPSSLGLGLLMR
jgi:transposase